MSDTEQTINYESPAIRDLGTLADMTGACQGFGGEDGAQKGNDPFTFSQPDFGDPSLCEGP